MAILYEGPATISLVDVIRNHSGLLQESWPDSSNDSFLPNKDCDEILRVDTIIYSLITLVLLVEYTSFLEPSMLFGIVVGHLPSYDH